jgi:hypothetical protein
MEIPCKTVTFSIKPIFKYKLFRFLAPLVLHFRVDIMHQYSTSKLGLHEIKYIGINDCIEIEHSFKVNVE